MIRRFTFGSVTALAILMATGACAGAAAPVAMAPVESVEVVATTEAEEAPVSPRAPREPDVSARDRWRTPFAVSSSGNAEPVRPRSVVVVDSDSVIAAGLLEQQAVELGAATRGSRSSGDRRITPASSSGDRGGDDVVQEATSSPERNRDLSSLTTSRGDDRRGTAEDRASDIEARSHVVQRGDTWLGIAYRYGVSPRELAEANPNVDSDRIRTGQRLLLPTAGERIRVHRVGPGDTLSEIAERYDVPQSAIRRANDLSSGDRIRVGQTLTIPPSD